MCIYIYVYTQLQWALLGPNVGINQIEGFRFLVFFGRFWDLGFKGFRV